MNPEFPNITCESFLSNLDKMQRCEKKLEDLRVKMTNPNINRDAVLKEREECKQNVEIMKGIVIRQITTGIWIEPKPAYVKKIKERISLEADYSRLTGKQMKLRKTD